MIVLRCALAIFAHPDDCEILCAGTMIRLREELGFELHVATCTAGDCGSQTLPRDAIAALRRNEAARAARLIGASYHCLNGQDFRVVYDRAAIGRTIDLFRYVNPSVVFTHPRVDYMTDHEVCHQLVRAASFAYAAPNASDVPVPEGARVPYLYYADPLLGLHPYSGDPAPTTTLVNISGVMDHKALMLQCHESQREWLRQHHGIDEYVDAMRRHGAARGGECGAAYAEAFFQHRGHPFPQDDLLSRLLTKDS